MQKPLCLSLCRAGKKMLRPALLALALGATAPVLAGYNICPTSKGSYVGGSIVDGNASCPDGSMGMYQSGNPYTWAPYSLDFGSVDANTSSSAQTITITNITNAYLGIPSAPTLSNGFVSGSTTSCSNGNLSPGASCTIKVIFTPTQAGSITGQASFKTSASATANTINLSGVGVAQSTPTSTPSSGTATYFNDCSKQAWPGGISCGTPMPMNTLWSSSDMSSAAASLGCTSLDHGVYYCGSASAYAGVFVTYSFSGTSNLSRIVYIH